MRRPVILAHGQDALLLANSIVALAIVMSLVSLGFAMGRKKETISRAGLVCASVALLLSTTDLRFGFAGGITLWNLARIAPVPLGILGGFLSIRRKTKT